MIRQNIADFARSNPALEQMNHADRIRLFAWFCHFHLGKDRFSTADISQCYQRLSMEPPTSVTPFLSQMERSKPKKILRDGRGRYLESKLFQDLSRKYADREISIQVSKLLEDLPLRVPHHSEREFLIETLICYRRAAFRAAVVMVWNLAYWHLCKHILMHRIDDFNQAYPTRLEGKWKKAKVQTIKHIDDFSVDLGEAEVIEVAKSAVIVTNDVYKILMHSLGKRNSAAHPSSVRIEQLQAEALIDDLVKNVVLVLAL